MSCQTRSIQSYFPPTKPTTVRACHERHVSDSKPATVSACSADSFSVPGYIQSDIGDLEPGPGLVSITGRVVNFFGQQVTSKLPLAAKGCVKIIVKDDTGAISVRLYHANLNYDLQLGHLVTLCFPHVSNGLTASLSCSSAPLFVSMFPERDKSCSFTVTSESAEQKALCRVPLDYNPERPLPGLTTLQSLLEDDVDPDNCKLLLYIKSVGALKKVTTKSGETSLLKVFGFDDTASATLTLWGAAAVSGATWRTSKPVLLVSYPACNNAFSRKPELSLSRKSFIELDPCILDADYLRNFAAKTAQRAQVNPCIPDGVFDVPAFLASETRILYRLADLDELIRATPTVPLIGFVSVVVSELNTVSLHARNMLCCSEHCGIPVFANTSTARCESCGADVQLRLNPCILGTMLDETGSIVAGRLLWTNEAWEQLFGRTVEEFLSSSADLLRYMELRMSYLRYTLIVGWVGDDVGRLCVLDVRT